MLYNFYNCFLFSKYFSCTFLCLYIYIYIYIYVCVCVCVFALLSFLCNFYSSPDYEGNMVFLYMGNYASTSRYGLKFIIIVIKIMVMRYKSCNYWTKLH